MNYKTLFVINAIVVAVFGALFLIAPDLTLTQFGVEKYVPMLYVARVLGSALLMIAIMIWFAKEITDAQTQKNMAIALLTGSVVGFILTVIGVIPSIGVIRQYGWVLLVIYFLFILGYGYLISGITIVPKGKQ
jgi:uncharacterized membrane protein YcgQ (UPF0703/DUF1980 family)